MDTLANIRELIYDHFHSSRSCERFFHDDESRFAQYYTSMYLIQDTIESLIHHRRRGFSGHPLDAYLEFWGVMQAVVIQQDAILELYEAIVGSGLSYSDLPNWQALRGLRNIAAGHPARTDRPKSAPTTRSFLGRNFGNYNSVTYEQWSSPGNITHPKTDLGVLIDRYAAEAACIMQESLETMQRQWPQDDAQ